jgi:hypothetical protein
LSWERFVNEGFYYSDDERQVGVFSVQTGGCNAAFVDGELYYQREYDGCRRFTTAAYELITYEGSVYEGSPEDCALVTADELDNRGETIVELGDAVALDSFAEIDLVSE